jgi:tRNA(Ile)-lysidine synthase
VVTAHTADDQAETILHRILRGTGIAGLAGMARTRPLGPAATLIRPLLGVRRSEIVDYLEALSQPYRHDSSNRDARLTRNRIRNELFPQLASQYNSGVVEALLRLGHLADELQDLVAGLVDELASRACVRQQHHDVCIALAPLAGQPRYVVRELLVTVWRQEGWPLQAMGFDQWDLLASMLLSRPDDSPAPAKRMFPGSVLVEVGDGVAGLRRLSAQPGS